MGAAHPAHRAITARLAAAILLLAAGCAIPNLPLERDTSSVTSATVARVKNLYFWKDRVDRRMLVGALDALESRFDSIRFEYDEDEDPSQGILYVGDARASVPVPEEVDVESFGEVLGQALHFVATHLPDEVNQDEATNLEHIALRGALRALDRYSTVFSGRRTDDFKIRFSGKLSGIGARIGRRDGHLTAIRVFPKSPAEQGGLRDGDALLEIDGDPSRPLSVSEAVDRIRGEAGTLVRFRVLREEEEFDAVVTRGEVVIPSVETEDLGDGIGYARITTVTKATFREFYDKISELHPVKGLVLDLRGNTGGSMHAAGGLADLFVSSGLIYRVVNSDKDAARGPRGQRHARPRTPFRFPVVVLLDPATASAAEILAGAIAPLDRVTLVGQKSFGKGVIQRVLPLPDENLLKLTVGQYLLSGDRAIHENGIEPDVELYPVPGLRLGRLAAVPEGALPYVREVGKDDRFPIEFGRKLLVDDADVALAEARAISNAEIADRLGQLDIPWGEETGRISPDLPVPLEIWLDTPILRGGEDAIVTIHITNPNEFEIPNAWLALTGPIPYLRNQLKPVGTLPAGETVECRIELTPEEGLSVEALPVEIHVASGMRALQTQKAQLTLESQEPELRIGVAPLDDVNLQVTLHNDGCCEITGIRITSSAATRSLEKLGPGTSETVELPIAGDSKEVFVHLGGAGVSRRIGIPVPDHRIEVTPPSLRVEHRVWLGRHQLRVEARAAEGLSEGWISLGHQKEVYVAWDGGSDGTLRSHLEEGENMVTTKVETSSGVSVFDVRGLTAD